MKNRISTASSGLIILLAALTLQSCSKEEPRQEGATPAATAPTQAATAPATTPATTPGASGTAAPAAQPQDPNAAIENALTAEIKSPSTSFVKTDNAGFESWDKGVPANWLLRDKKTKVTESSDASEGKASLQFPPTRKHLMYVYQDLPLNNTMAGKKVTVTAMAKASAPSKIQLWGYSLINKVQSKTITSTPHIGDGQWHRLGFTIDLPANIADGKICYVLESSESAKPALFDAVKIYTK